MLFGCFPFFSSFFDFDFVLVGISAFDGIESQISYMIVLFLTLFAQQNIPMQFMIIALQKSYITIHTLKPILFKIQWKEKKNTTNTDSWAHDTLTTLCITLSMLTNMILY